VFDDVIEGVLESSFTQCFPLTINYHLPSQHLGYVKCEPREICLDNKALQFKFMVMSGAHYLIFTPGMNDATHFKALSLGTLHTNFIHRFH
jgi:hypothetical protein